MSGLLEDVLLFSKAEAGRMEFNPVALDLKKFCAQLVDEALSATSRRCPIELSLAEISEPARGDEGLLRHIFSNLIANAAKYSPPGTPVNFSVSRDGGDAIFIVQDRGLGIPEDDRKRLFTPFYRGKNVATIQGTGLGLVIVKHCVERHGGMIQIESAENCGTTVSVRLPLFSPAHTEFIKRISEKPEA
jgi:signal transduction histidine kinase